MTKMIFDMGKNIVMPAPFYRSADGNIVQGVANAPMAFAFHLDTLSVNEERARAGFPPLDEGAFAIHTHAETQHGPDWSSMWIMTLLSGEPEAFASAIGRALAESASDQRVRFLRALAEFISDERVKDALAAAGSP